MKKYVTWMYLLFVVYLISLILVYSTGLVDVNNRILWQNLLFLIAPLLAIIAGVYSLKKYSRKSIHGKTLFFLVLGLVSSFLAEFILFVTGYLDIEIGPLFTYLFYILAYIFFLVAIVYQFKIGKISWTKSRLISSIIAVFVLIIITYQFGVLLPYNPEFSLLENIVILSYGVIDFVVVLFLILLANLCIEFRKGIFSKSWQIIILGFISLWIGDILFSLFMEQYNALNWFYKQIDYFWIAQYLLIGYGVFIQGRALKQIIKVKRKKRRRKTSKIT